MRHFITPIFFVTLAAFLLNAGAGCKKAGTFGVTEPPPKSKPEDRRPPATTEKPKPLPTELAWMVPTPQQLQEMEPVTPIRYVHRERDLARWNKLDKLWTLVNIPRTPLGKESRHVLIKVPLGLPDPTPYIPPANPPTAGKWVLGKQLFFDRSYLWPPGPNALSCASCHQPAHGFTAGTLPLAADKMRVPTLFNVVYSSRLFWDGRVTALERVVQGTLDDEREPAPLDARLAKHRAERRHVWSGVVTRLRANKEYAAGFQKVFGTLPTQDNIGKALATYMRTILVGNSTYDRAWLAAGAKLPRPADYAGLLDVDTLKALRREGENKDGVGAEIAEGVRLFHGSARCARCHKGPDFFTDGDFHNAGIRESERINPARPVGRFLRLPIGLKDRRMLGAFKTPTLRGLPQTAPYFHDGSAGNLIKEDGVIEALMRHVKQKGDNLDPALRNLEVPEPDIRALALFLRCLDGKVDPVVAEDNKWPEGAAPDQR